MELLRVEDAVRWCRAYERLVLFHGWSGRRLGDGRWTCGHDLVKHSALRDPSRQRNVANLSGFDSRAYAVK